MVLFLVPYQLSPCPWVVQSPVDSTVIVTRVTFLVAEYRAMCLRSGCRSKLLQVMPRVAVLLVACPIDSTFQREGHMSSFVWSVSLRSCHLWAL